MKMKRKPTDEDMIKEGSGDSMKYENSNYGMNNDNSVRNLLFTLFAGWVQGYELNLTVANEKTVVTLNFLSLQLIFFYYF